MELLSITNFRSKLRAFQILSSRTDKSEYVHKKFMKDDKLSLCR